MKKTRTLYVRRTNRDEIGEQWGDKSLTVLFKTDNLYVRCTKDRLVNDWSSAPIYGAEELIEKNNVKICK